MADVGVIVVGAAGRMGRMIIQTIQEGGSQPCALVGAIDVPGQSVLGQDAGVLASGKALGVKITSDLAAVARPGHVVIDFTTPAAMFATARIAAEKGSALVVGTTGLKEAELAALRKIAATIPVVQTANMSLGVNLLLSLLNKAALALKERGYDVEIIERHHRRKKDSPSGTALALGQAVADGFSWDLKEVAVNGRAGLEPGDRPVPQIGFHAVRGGDIVGDHTVLFAAEGECLEFSHRATTRQTFARGALQAAAWLARQPAGFYTMRDVLGV